MTLVMTQRGIDRWSAVPMIIANAACSFVRLCQSPALATAQSAALATALGLFAHSASAQGTVTNLHPGDWPGSNANGVFGAHQVGTVFTEGIGTYHHAGMWSGTADSWVSLELDGAEASAAFGVWGKPAGGLHGLPLQNDVRTESLSVGRLSRDLRFPPSFGHSGIFGVCDFGHAAGGVCHYRRPPASESVERNR